MALIEKGKEEQSTTTEYLEAIKEFRRMAWETPAGWFWKAYIVGIAWVVITFSSMLLALWPISHLYLHAKVAEYCATKASITLQRISHPPIHDAEMRGMSVEIVRWNGWLAYWKRWREVPFVGLYIPEEIEPLTPME